MMSLLPRSFCSHKPRRFVATTLTTFFFSSIICLLGFSAPASGDDLNQWNNFRGPGGNGVAADSAAPPISWSNDSENLKWKTEIPGRGSSSPIVWDDKIYLLTSVPTDRAPEKGEGRGTGRDGAEPEGRDRSGGNAERGGRGGRGGRGRQAPPSTVHEFHVVCIDRETGNIDWQTKVNEAVPHESGHSTNTFASSSAVTNGEHIYASFGSFGIHCLTMSGDIVWQRDLGDMSTRRQFGEGASPALYENRLVVPWDHEGQSFIETMDAATGEKIWNMERDELTSWATPLIVKHGDRVQVVTNGATRVRSYDLESGEIIWECGGQTGNPIPTPMLLDETAIVMTGFRSNAAFAIPLDSTGDITGQENQIVWHRNDIGPYVATGVLYQGSIYSTKDRPCRVSSISAESGETVFYETRLDGIDSIYASLVAANGYVFITGRNGTTVVLLHGDEMVVSATNEPGEAVDATPAIVDNQIIIRGERNLFCFENE